MDSYLRLAWLKYQIPLVQVRSGDIKQSFCEFCLEPLQATVLGAFTVFQRTNNEQYPISDPGCDGSSVLKKEGYLPRDGLRSKADNQPKGVPL